MFEEECWPFDTTNTQRILAESRPPAAPLSTLGKSGSVMPLTD